MLTATGDITDEQRQEFILWSDALGPLDARRRDRAPAAGGRDRVDRARALLRAGLAAARVRRGHRRAGGRHAGLGARPRVDATDGDADRRRRARRLAERRQPALRGPGRGRARGPPARPLPDARRRQLRLPRACGRCPTRSPTTGRSADARRDRPPSVAAGPHPHDRPRARLPDARHAHLRPRERRTSTPTRSSRSSPPCCARSSSATPATPTRRRESTAAWCSLECTILLAPGAAQEPVDSGRTA